MANISIRRGGGGEPPARRPSGPLEVVRDLLRWDPFAEMLPGWGEEERTMFVPDFDVKETKDGFSFTADMPGINAENLDIKLAQNRLTVSGKKEHETEEKTDTFYRRERSFGEFSRSFRLPEEADAENVAAELKNGVLKVTVPKRPERQPKKVDVKIQ